MHKQQEQRHSLKIVLVLYGIGRGPTRAFKSITNNIIQPIQALGHDLTIVYILKNVSSDPQRTEPINALCEKADILRVYEEEQLLDEALFQESRNFRDKHNDSYVSNRNLICQLRKLQISTEIIDYHSFDRVILCRDDLDFKTGDLKWSVLLYTSAYIPITTALFWNNGMSERFFIGRPEVMELFANRIRYCMQSILHSDCLNGEYLQLYVASTEHIKVGAAFIRFFRIRAEDLVERERVYPAVWRLSETLRVVVAYLRFQYYRTLAKSHLLL